MTSLYVDRQGADLELEGDTIVVRIDGKREGTAPLRSIDRVIVRSGGRLASRLISRLNDKKIGLVLLSGRSNEPAAILSPASGDSDLRIQQYTLVQDEILRQRLSRDLVRGKVAAQVRLLRDIAQERPSKRLKDAIERLDNVSEKLSGEEPTRARLRGIEGAASAAYFSGFISLFPSNLDFTDRNRRPPRDPVNVCLSLGYTLLHHEAVRSLISRGLDPTLGLYHDIAPGRDSLACDLAEPVRPAIDRFVHMLFAENTLDRSDFSTRGKACRLDKDGRRAFYRAYEDVAAPIRRLLDRTVGRLVVELSLPTNRTPQIGAA